MVSIMVGLYLQFLSATSATKECVCSSLFVQLPALTFADIVHEGMDPQIESVTLIYIITKYNDTHQLTNYSEHEMQEN